jgi:hypothetical protein
MRRSSMLWTLQNIHALTYVLHGESPPRGIVWAWLLRRRQGPVESATVEQAEEDSCAG